MSEEKTESNVEALQSTQVTNAPSPTNNKKLILIIATILGALLVLLIALLLMLVNKKDEPERAVNQNDSNSSQNEEKQDTSIEKSKKIIKTLSTQQKDVELLIYEPVQNATNTTINFGLKNICTTNCKRSIDIAANEALGLGNAVSGLEHENYTEDVYIVDNAGAQKYKLITDEDGKALATPSCEADVAPGKVLDCFVAFTQVPSGSTVSIVLGDTTKVDNIKLP